MAETTDAMWASMLNNNQNSWLNNPFLYLIFLAMFGNGNFFGRGNTSGAADAGLAQQMQDNHNSDLLMSAIKGNADAASSLASNLNVGVDSINAAINALGNQMSSCCCSNKMETQKMGYENQISNLQQTNSLLGRIDTLSNGVQTGFASVGYEAQANANNIIQAGNANTQRIIDRINESETQGLRDKLWQLSQDAQTTSIVSQLKTTSTTTA